jgi:uncharacterized protein YecT (DUF1311 family)
VSARAYTSHGASHDPTKRSWMGVGAALVLLSSSAILPSATEALGQQQSLNAPSNRTKPPLVAEPPGPAPVCNQQTQVGIDGCAYEKVIAADKMLNAEIKVIWALLGPSARTDFVNAQAAWVKYRHADCSSQSDVYQGGTAQPMEYLFCLAATMPSAART